MTIYSEQELIEFKAEATELFDKAEADLLQCESSKTTELYDSIFRVFHSIKGGAGMFGYTDLQKHLHQLESLWGQKKTQSKFSKDEIEFFLNGIDISRSIMSGQSVDTKIQATLPESPPPKKAVIASQDLDRLVYVVDDEESILEIISDYLKEANFKAVTFLDPLLLIEEVKKQSPALVMSDIKMPQLSGLELLTKLREINPDLPVILVSGYIDKDILLNAMAAGVFAALEKPFKANVLISYAQAATRHYNLLKMIRKTLKLLVYQSSDLDNFLKNQGKTDIANTLKNEIKELLIQFKALNPK